MTLPRILSFSGSQMAQGFAALLLTIPGCNVSAIAKDRSQLSFVKNLGQWPQQVNYRADIPGGAVWCTSTGLTYCYLDLKDIERIHDKAHLTYDLEQEKIAAHAYTVRFIGANPNVAIKGESKAPFYHNYIKGKDTSKWRGNVPVYKEVFYENLYEGIDLRMYSKGNALKYDVLIAAGKDPSVFSMQFEGVTPKLTTKGILVKTSVNTIVEQTPYAYQIISGRTIEVPCFYEARGDGRIGFRFPRGYNRNFPLVIDPLLVFGTYSGSVGVNWGFSATYDASGNSYAGGYIFDVGWPSTVGAFQMFFGGATDVAINKYSPDGTTLIYSTYYGGGNAEDPSSMIVNNSGELIIIGSTNSGDLPTTAGAYNQAINGGKDLYVAHFNASGSGLIGATYVGGSSNDGVILGLSGNYGDNHRCDIVLNPGGGITIVTNTQSPNFPTTTGVFQPVFGGGQQDACILKLSDDCSTLIWSTFLGGSNNDNCMSMVKNSAGNLVVCGSTNSLNFPATPGSYHPTFNGGADGIAAILTPDGDSLLYATYIGTNVPDYTFKVQVDLSDNVWVCGQTASLNYPVTPGAFTHNNGTIFLHKFSADLSSSLLSTRFISGGLVPTAFFLDSCENVYVGGWNADPFQPVTPDAFQPVIQFSPVPTSWGSFYFCVLSNDLTTLKYATYVGTKGDHSDGGSSRCDARGIMYLSVCCPNNIFPTTANSWSPANQVVPPMGGTIPYDVVNFKFDFEMASVVATIDLLGNRDSICISEQAVFINNSIHANSYFWDFGDGTSDTAKYPAPHIFPDTGTYVISLAAHNNGFCVNNDTAYLTVYVFNVSPPQLFVKDTLVCKGGKINLYANVSNLNSNLKFHWSPANAIVSNPDSQFVEVDCSVDSVFTVTVRDSMSVVCDEVVSGTIRVHYFDTTVFKAFQDTTICPMDTAFLFAVGGDYYNWSPSENMSEANVAQVIVWPEITTDFGVVIRNGLGCEATRTVRVEVKEPVPADAGPDQELKIGESTYLNATGGVTYEWTPPMYLTNPHSASTKVYPEKSMTYYVNVFSAEGCRGLDSVNITLMNASVPTAFSPNGDGLNDLFHLIISDSRVRLIELSVYNRWGERMFYSVKVTDGWDGTYKGQPVEVGSYFYQLTYAIGKKQYFLKGDVALIR